MTRTPIRAALAGALLVVAAVGVFIAVDRTTLHWYSAEGASPPTATPTATATSTPTSTATPNPTATATVVPPPTTAASRAAPTAAPAQPPAQPASPRFQPAEAITIAARYWIGSDPLPSEEIYGCQSATWTGTAWRVICERSICANAGPGRCGDISPIVLCVYEDTETVRGIWSDESC